MSTKRFLPALLAALLLAAPAMAAEHAPEFEACIKKKSQELGSETVPGYGA